MLPWLYSKTCVKRPLKTRQNKDLNDKWQHYDSRKYCRMLPLEHSATLLTCIKRNVVLKKILVVLRAAVLHRFYCTIHYTVMAVQSQCNHTVMVNHHIFNHFKHHIILSEKYPIKLTTTLTVYVLLANVGMVGRAVSNVSLIYSLG